MAVIPDLEQEDHKFEGILDYVVRLCLKKKSYEYFFSW
jgi:hypothetical protein